MSTKTPTSLLTQLRNNKDEGWERLKILYGKLILYWCAQKSVPEADREDIFQNVMISVVNGFAHFEKTETGHTFRGWLRNITQNRIADFYRNKGERPHEVPFLLDNNLEWSATSISEEENEEEQRLLTHQVMKLIARHYEGKEKLWELLQLSIRGEITSEQASQELGMTPSAFRQQKSRLVHSIREEFGELFQ
ncbi:MAG: sigma-70 family RNA polymerase sigma factor [Planctomycetia bacterium]|nr:sigma-70 family RNA polymerase sigma factor [Planctomycetia bacterium]